MPKNKNLLHVRDLPRYWGIQKNKVLTGPRRIELEINTRCNLNCLFCWFHSPAARTKIRKWELELNLFKKIMDDAGDIGVQHVYITGRGEPCLHPSLPQMLSYAKSKGFYVTLTSNLTILSREILNSILLIDNLEITFCGYPERKYKQLQCPKTKNLFDILIRNISRIAKIAALRGKPLITINCILTKRNINTIGEFIEFCGKIGVQEIRLTPFSSIPLNRSLRPTASQMKKLKRKFGRVTGKEKPIIDNSWLHLEDIKIEGCYMGWITALIGVFGKVKIGCFDSPLNSEGNIYKSSLKEIWYSELAHLNRLKLKNSLREVDFCPFYSTPLKKEEMRCPFSLENAFIEASITGVPF